MVYRPRRLRRNEQIRKMVRETRVGLSSLVMPLFIVEGKNKKTPIESMEGQYRYSPDQVLYKVENLLEKGVENMLLFGIPDHKDVTGTGAYHPQGVVQEAVRTIKSRFPETYLITDVCMCEYTSHGHCGILEGGEVSNSSTLPVLAKIALSHAQAGCDMVAPSDMMDGRVAAIRSALDQNGYSHLPVMSYAVKYASAFYGPFREAAGSQPEFGDRKTYQMDYHNGREAVREAVLDIEEGADIIMVKPAAYYLDIVNRIAALAQVPVAAYSVSGEYAMVKAAEKAGYMDGYQAMCESAVGVFRSGADILVSYFAAELALAIKKGDLG